MRPRSSQANATGWRTSGSAATSSTLKPSGTYIWERVRAASGLGAGAVVEGAVGFALRWRKTGLDWRRSIWGKGSSANAIRAQVRNSAANRARNRFIFFDYAEGNKRSKVKS